MAWAHLGSTGGLSLQWLQLPLFGTYCVPGTVVNILPFNRLKSSVGQTLPDLPKVSLPVPVPGPFTAKPGSPVWWRTPVLGPREGIRCGMLWDRRVPLRCEAHLSSPPPWPPRGLSCRHVLVLPFPKRHVSDPGGWGRAGLGLQHRARRGDRDRRQGSGVCPRLQDCACGYVGVEESRLRACECF